MSKPLTAIVCGERCVAPPGDYFVTCSFDKNHVLLRSRMPYHIVKCIKQHPGHNKLQCPFDSTEYIDPEDYQAHLETCDSRESLGTVEEKYELARLKAEGNLFGIKQTPFFHESHPEPDEDWGGRADPQLDVSDEFSQPGAGRGVRLRTQSKPKKGMGRAEVLARLIKQYEEELTSAESSGASSSSSRLDSLRGSIVEGQFDDK